MVADFQLRGGAHPLANEALALRGMQTMVAQLEVPSMRHVCSAGMDRRKTLRPVRTELPLLPPRRHRMQLVRTALRKMRRSMGIQNSVLPNTISITKLQRPMKFHAENRRRLRIISF